MLCSSHIKQTRFVNLNHRKAELTLREPVYHHLYPVCNDKAPYVSYISLAYDVNKWGQAFGQF